MKIGRSNTTRGYWANLKKAKVKDTNQNFFPLPLGSSEEMDLTAFGVELCLSVCQSIHAGIPIITDAKIKTLKVTENPKNVIPMPDTALPTAMESHKTAIFFVDSFSFCLVDKEKIAVRFTAQ